MSGEGVAEEVYEAGIEVIDPGGRPDVLRDAADGWRAMRTRLGSLFSELDQQVESTLGEHWRGAAADAFSAHWNELTKAVDATLPLFEEAARGLDEAAKSIEEVNEEIHQIYLEIGVSVAAGVALSFVTVGFGAAAGAANAVRLAGQAARAATRLGALLSRVARCFRAVQTMARHHRAMKLLLTTGVQYAGGLGSGMATSVVGGKGLQWRENLVNAGFGVLGGAGAGAAIGGRLGGGIVESAVTGGVGGAGASVAGDLATNAVRGERNDAAQIGIGAVTGGLGGAAGGAAAQHALHTPRRLGGARGLGIDVGVNGAVGVGAGTAGDRLKDTRESAAASDEHHVRRLRGGPDTEKFGAFG
ncbi:WXG100 family type VII secretion target [Streptomyces sp. NPDC088785]|uniref:WXG100 family type VII secretion target n=1 Tax=Streptomyces sp. NPDC088785 TaxID=3365897 RepID=UPI0038108378